MFTLNWKGYSEGVICNGNIKQKLLANNVFPSSFSSYNNTLMITVRTQHLLTHQFSLAHLEVSLYVQRAYHSLKKIRRVARFSSLSYVLATPYTITRNCFCLGCSCGTFRNCLLFRNTWVHPRFFSGVRVTRSLLLYVCFVDRCLFFVLLLLAIVLSVRLRYTESDYLFGIFKIFF